VDVAAEVAEGARSSGIANNTNLIYSAFQDGHAHFEPCPSFVLYLLGCLAGAGVRLGEFLHYLVDREARRLLPGRELFERSLSPASGSEKACRQ
jgi:hypothetical protein